MCQKTKATKHVSTPHIPPARTKDEGRTDEGRTDICFSSLTNGKALRAIKLTQLNLISATIFGKVGTVAGCNIRIFLSIH